MQLILDATRVPPLISCKFIQSNLIQTMEIRKYPEHRIFWIKALYFNVSLFIQQLTRFADYDF